MATTISNSMMEVILTSAVNSLEKSFFNEMKKRLMIVAEKEIDDIVSDVTERVKVKISSYISGFSMSRDINIDWTINGKSGGKNE